MKRRLRIAVSVFFALVAAVLCVLWVRSYWRHDSFQVQVFSYVAGISSAAGEIYVGYEEFFPGFDVSAGSTPIVPEIDRFRWFGSDGESKFPTFGFGIGSGYSIFVPIWFPVLICATIAAITWRISTATYKFSLRTLLIATTLVAVVLGLIVFATRAPKSPPIDHVDGPGRIPVNR